MSDHSKTQAQETTATQPTSEPSVPLVAPMPQRIGRYALEERIAAGGMGVVYRARHIETTGVVALKLLRHDLASESGLARFRRESQLLSQLRHPTIATVYDAGTESIGGTDVPYIAMEYVPEAETITSYARKNNLSTRERIELFAKVCRGVHHAHEHRIIHRDLKPSNILIDPEGNPKIIDFGVAKTFNPESTIEAGHTLSGQVIGTIKYMSPEQSRDSASIDHRSDIYSLGVVLYELVCGRMPYRIDGVTPIEALQIIQDRDPAQPSTHTGSLSRDLETIILRMMSKERSRRFPTALKVAEDLENYLAGRPIWARGDSVLYVWKKELALARERGPWLTAVGIWVLAIIIAMIFGPSIWYHKSGLAGRYTGFITRVAGEDSHVPRHVAVIGLRDIEALAREAPALGLAPINPAAIQSVRPAHAALLDRLAECSVRSVAIDFVFLNCAPEYDAPLLSSIERLSAQGISTVVGKRSFHPGTAENPGFCAEYARVARAGAIVVSPGRQSSGFAVRLGVYSQETKDTYISFGVAAFAATRHPGLDYEATLDDGFVRLNYREDAGGVGRRQLAGGFDLLPATEIGPIPIFDPIFGIKAGDPVASSAFSMPAAAFDESEPFTTDMVDALRMPIEDLRRRVRDKAVVVIDLRPGMDEDVDPAGRTFHKGYLWACWLDQALGGTTVRGPGERWAMQQVLIGAALGAIVLPIPFFRKRVISVGFLCFLTAATILLSVVLLRMESMLFVPLLGLFAMWIAGLFAVLIPPRLET